MSAIATQTAPKTLETTICQTLKRLISQNGDLTIRVGDFRRHVREYLQDDDTKRQLDTTERADFRAMILTAITTHWPNLACEFTPIGEGYYQLTVHPHRAA